MKQLDKILDVLDFLKVQNEQLTADIGGYSFIRIRYCEFYKKFTTFKSGYGVIAANNAVKRKNPNILGAKDLCYVHGSDEELLSGKKCVIRDDLRFFLRTDISIEEIKGLAVEKYEQVLYKEVQGVPYKSVPFENGRLILIGHTQSGNAKVVYKKS